MEGFVLFRGTKTVTVRTEDMRIDRIAHIFQVSAAEIYITDASNTVIFPRDDGCFSSLDLNDRAHYEVHGSEAVVSRTPTPAAPGPQRPFSFRQPQLNMSQLQQRSPAPARSFQRSIHISDIVDGKVISTRLVVIRFVEAEATVPGILQKVKLAMADEEDYILIDSLGHEIVESEGTCGSVYWKQNARKIHAVLVSAFRQLRQRRSRSRNEHSGYGVSGLRDQVEDLLEASHGLDDVTQKINEMVAASREIKVMQRPEVKQAFACLICRDTMNQPMFSTCCRSLVGCRVCVEEWRNTSSMCLKCRDVDPLYTEVVGLSMALDFFRSLP